MFPWVIGVLGSANLVPLQRAEWGWVAENGGCIAGCAYPTEKSGLDFRNASIHRLFLSSMNTGIFVPPRIEMTFVKVVVTIGKRWYCRVPLWRKEQASEIE
jgi:hypothetical protein